MAPQIGEFEVDPSTVTEAPLPPKGENVVVLVEKAERKIGQESGSPFISLQLALPDFPGGKIFHSYFPASAKALAARSSAISWKKFLDKLGLPYTTQAKDLENLRFIAQLRHKGQGDEAEAVIDKVVGKA